jgi:uncharacterized UPF0160 family protein
MSINFFKHKIIVATHSGDFHADDVFACAVLLLWAEKYNNRLKIIRTRDEHIIKKADIAVDVGGIYNPDENKFDHHQKNGAGKRENGIPYASFGLIWKKYGEIVCGDNKIAEIIEKKTVLPIDARDNGINITVSNERGINDYMIKYVIENFNTTWQEDKRLQDEQFKKALYFAKEILLREIAWTKAFVRGEEETVKVIKEQNEPAILILENKIEWHEAVSKNKKIKLVVYPRADIGWSVQVARDDLEDYDSNRIEFPQNWLGLRDENLIQSSGIKDAIFCSSGGWIAAAQTKEGAIEMAEKALQIRQN